MKLTRLLVTAAACAGLSAAHAQSAASAPAASSAKHELVLKLLSVQQSSIESLGRSVGERPAMQLMQAAAQALQTQVPEDKREAAANAAQAHIKDFVEETDPAFAKAATQLAPTTMGPILESQLSEDDLRQIIAWVSSPTFKRFSELQPQLQDALVKSLIQQMGPTMEPKLRTLQQTVAKDLGLEIAGSSAAPAPSGSTAKRKKK